MSATPDRPTPQLPPHDLQPFEYVSTRHDAKVSQGVTLEDLLNPAFWAHHAVRLRPMDEIRARAEDGSWVVYLTVLDASRTWARVKVLSEHNLGTADVALTQATQAEAEALVAKIKADYAVTFRGPHRWSVIRRLDKNLMTEGHQEKGDAELWLDKFARDQGSAPPPVVQPA